MDSAIYEEVKSKLIEYANNIGCSINFHGKQYYYTPELNQITVPARSKQSWIQCIGILHELGHAQQQPTNIPAKSKQHKQCIIIELEYQAWIEASNIARQLELFEYEEFHDVFYSEFTKHWSSYIKHIPTYTVTQTNWSIQQYASRVTNST